MLYYDDRDYYDPDNIDELYDSEEDAYDNEWEYNYHNIAEELCEE